MRNSCHFISQNPKILKQALFLIPSSAPFLPSSSETFETCGGCGVRCPGFSPVYQRSNQQPDHIKIPLLIYPNTDILSLVCLNIPPSVLERIVLRNSPRKTVSAFLHLWIECVIRCLICNDFCDKFLPEYREKQNVLLDTKVYNSLH